MTSLTSLKEKMQNLSDLAGYVALVTGGGTGIGLMIARGLAIKGAKVFITGRRLDVLENAAAENAAEEKGCIVPLRMDVTNKSSILSAVECIEQTEGRLNVLVNNAGIPGPGAPATWSGVPEKVPDSAVIAAYGRELFDQSYEALDTVVRTDFAAAFFVTTAFLGLLARGAEGKEARMASVINISSVAAHSKLQWGYYAYDCAKAALSTLTRLFATDFALKRAPIRVNAISPGPFPSDFTPDGVSLEELLQTNFLGSIVPHPLRRAGREEEIAVLAVYLASPISDFATGQGILLDGGFHLVNP